MEDVELSMEVAMPSVIRETSTHYIIEVEQDSLTQGPVILQHGGQPVAALVSMEDYRAFRQWQTQRQGSTPPPADLQAEIAAFARLKPALLKQYPGRAVALYQGEVVAVGDDKMEVLANVYARLGEVHCYVEWVEPETPRRVRMPSAWRVKRC
jgi:hypothetical protein